MSSRLLISKRSITTTNNNLLNTIQVAKPDKILGLTEKFNQDKNQKKVNLTVGIYKDAWGKVSTLPSVALAQRQMGTLSTLNWNLSYLPIVGCEKYHQNVKNFLFNECMKDLKHFNNGVSFFQTLSGTGAIAITARFLSKFISNKIWLPNYSWANHINIFEKNGFHNSINYYSYYNDTTGKLAVDKWLNDLRINVSKDKSNVPHCIVLHACCHNPTGIDPTKEEWTKIIDTVHELNMIPIIDMAYQGLESGDVVEDAYVLRSCLQDNRKWHNGLYLCQSFAKNMGLYGERVGSLSIITPYESLPSVRLAIDSQIKKIIRSMYSSPPGYGSRIVNTILSDEKLKKQWFKDVNSMVNRLHSIRNKLFEQLHWDDLVEFGQQHGMFYFTRFTPKQVNQLKQNYSIYLTEDGRLSLSGINDSNLDYVCEALMDVSKVIQK
ncbi:hypothetical protein KAFR_0D03160 [Kazachstania africana CBS 2517]|uniref:Aspartate aminotransferase n=1 Tax=Kazachstania africana (strain ATCC 22294 / BCRC 22015 / CBS 2517 / CECT 1963 / NBRC 1671 / NRRL Y-8276) TaxID=1071382 RepID=H2AUB4_KAZAF|nr:hypothetical protein KAFR_0D03160 [Kazachstania africana CBS 2517]CCF57964.1 hypothetical protein KAFR_0D03160 [Kazachstania africana CBS 2517]